MIIEVEQIGDREQGHKSLGA